ncbi:protein ACCELERATED CELL DEATH 6-like isoform X2 [Prosopis cineraria]|uniref:protein ACCELERATED CELL DEATH 6-like isoform X2 n=1 Tax=Prosopis cineraria TaxID=364024 RepID=UPI00240F888D|nr:protein ACCELERATED CELL DEATH 6-like isoform X2 [Prosopis cineraria]
MRGLISFSVSKVKVVGHSIGKSTQQTHQYMWQSKQGMLKFFIASCRFRFPQIGTFIGVGGTPLFAAISKRNTTLLKEIVADEKQQLLYLRDEHGNTPLHYAAYSSYVEGVRELLTKSNLVAFQRNLNGDLPIHIACRNRHVQVVKELLSGGWPYTRIWLNNKGQNILHIAAESGQNDMVKFLLKHSDIHAANVNEKDLNGDAPLHLASRKLHLWTLLHLSRDERIDVNLVNDQSLTARDIVWMQTKYPRTGQELLARMILKTAGIPLNKNLIRMPRAANKEWNVKDGANSLITVAVLIATVTFAAGFTVPGFYPLGIRLPLFRQVGELSIRIIIILFHGRSDYWIYRASEIYQNDQNGNANHGNLINPVTHHVDDLLAI